MAIKDIMKTSMQNFANEAYKRFAEKSEIKAYSLAKAVTADAGYLATYQMTQDGVAIGDKINIPKDFLVTAVTETPLTVAAADKASGGVFENNNDFAVGDKYVRFTVNVKAGGDDTPTYMYINLNSLVDEYTGDGNGIVLGNGNVFSLKIDSTNANGLSVTSDGLKLGLASASTNGALASTDFAAFSAKQEQIVVGAATGNGNAITAISLNADNKTIDIVKGSTFVLTSDIEELTASECVTIFNNAKTAAEQAAQQSGD